MATVIEYYVLILFRLLTMAGHWLLGGRVLCLARLIRLVMLRTLCVAWGIALMNTGRMLFPQPHINSQPLTFLFDAALVFVAILTGIPHDTVAGNEQGMVFVATHEARTLFRRIPRWLTYT